jgi:hypothetical protein
VKCLAIAKDPNTAQNLLADVDEQLWLSIKDASMSVPQSEHLMIGTCLAMRGGKFIVLLIRV